MQAIRMRHSLGFGLLAAMLAGVPAAAQTSNGSDGALNIQSSNPLVVNGVYTWDPVRDGLDTDGDNVYHFTTVTIGQNVIVRLRANRMRRQGPVVFLASGAVTINGWLDVSGDNGVAASTVQTGRSASIPGPGGFPGGAGAKVGDVPQSGAGPGAGTPSANNSGFGCPASHATAYFPNGAVNSTNCPAPNGQVYANPLIQPLIGGSGGGGAEDNAQIMGGGGGAGGGAIRVRSAVSITLQYIGGSYSGAIYANGGDGGVFLGTAGGGGAGSGGSIHLQAPLVNMPSGGNSILQAAGGGMSGYGSLGGNGRIRIDTDNWICASCSVSPTAVTGPFVETPLPVNVADLKVVSVNGVSAPANPLNRYLAPDVTIPGGVSSVPVVLQTANIPNGTTLNLLVSTDPGSADQVVNGTVNNNQVTVNVNFQNNAVSRLWVKAAW